MNNTFLVTVLIVISYKSLFAQVGVVNNQVQSHSYVGATTYQIPVRKPGLVGTTFLDDDWLIGNVYLEKGAALKNTPIKYDILNQQILFKEGTRTMSILLNYADSFNILNPDGTYMNFLVNKSWTQNQQDASGVYRKLTDFDEYGLVKKYTIILIKANYNVALSAGEMDDKYVTKEELYLVNNSKNELIEIPKSKKKLVQYFDDQKVENFIKMNKIRSTEISDLIDLVNFVNNAL